MRQKTVVKFQAFKNGKVVNKLDLAGAYLFGSDGIVIRRAKIGFSKGFIHCNRSNLQTAGLVLPWRLEGYGRVMLPTTFLRERDEPYNLNLEIARGKLMQILNKCEDWSIFNMQGTDSLFGEARQLFIEALQNAGDRARAAKLADQALVKALACAEKLAVERAQVAFKIRGKNRGFGRGCLGCIVEPKRLDEPGYVDRLVDLFGYVTIPVNWQLIEPEKGQYDFSTVNKCVEVLGRKRLTLGAGPLLCFEKKYIPRRFLRGRASFERIRECAYEFVSEMVSRYAGAVRTWSVVSGLNCSNHFDFNFEQMLEMTRASAMAAKSADAQARRIVVVSDPWGQYYADDGSTIPPVVYMDMVVQSGISFDGFGLQMQSTKSPYGVHFRDMMQISSVLDNFLPFGKPFYISGISCPSQGTGNTAGATQTGGRAEWSPAAQRQWVERFYQIALSKPFVDAVTYSNLADSADAGASYTGLLTEGLEPKEAFNGLKKLQQAIFSR